MLKRFLIQNANFLCKNPRQHIQIKNISYMCINFNMKNYRASTYQIRQSHQDPKLERPPEKMFNVKKKEASEFTWRNLAITGFFALVLLAFMAFLQNKKKKEKEVKKITKLGKAAIGGAYEMTDHTGKSVTNESFLGKWVLLYFGFTHCPDICPEELDKLVVITNKISKIKGAKELVPIFVSVDHARDDVETVAKYIKEYSPKLVGLTGTSEQVDRMTKNYRVHYSLGEKDEEDDYIVDHSSSIYLIDPDGEFIDYYGITNTAQQLIDSITLHMMKYQYKR